MAIENSVSNYSLSTFVESINVFDCRLSGVVFKGLNEYISVYFFIFQMFNCGCIHGNDV